MACIDCPRIFSDTTAGPSRCCQDNGATYIIRLQPEKISAPQWVRLPRRKRSYQADKDTYRP